MQTYAVVILRATNAFPMRPVLAEGARWESKDLAVAVLVLNQYS